MRQGILAGVLAAVVIWTGGLLSAAEEGQAPWRPLFNGKDLEGWEKHGGAAKYWVEDGTIVGQSVPNTRNTFLCTKEQFGDFELLFEVKVDDALNSGVQIRSQIKDNDVVFGPQVEIAAGPGPAGYIYGESTGRGWLSQERTVTKAFKNGQWNRYRVLCQGPNIKTWVNDVPVADLTDEQSSRSGLIGLQVHGVGKREDPLFVRWRNIMIRELK